MPLSGDGQLGGQRACGRFAVVEQQVEQTQSHWVTERRPQPIGVLAVRGHGVSRESVIRVA